MTKEDIKNVTDIVHKTIYEFFDTCGDNEEVPIADKDKLLLEANKAICNNIKAFCEKPGYIIMPNVSEKTGHWIDRWDKIFLCEYKDCSICGHMARTRYNFCPNCGAKMVEQQKSEVKK